MEREAKLKYFAFFKLNLFRYALNVMGCKIYPYWIGTFCFDLLIYILIFFVFVFYCYAKYFVYDPYFF